MPIVCINLQIQINVPGARCPVLVYYCDLIFCLTFDDRNGVGCPVCVWVWFWLHCIYGMVTFMDSIYSHIFLNISDMAGIINLFNQQIDNWDGCWGSNESDTSNVRACPNGNLNALMTGHSLLGVYYECIMSSAVLVLRAQFYFSRSVPIFAERSLMLRAFQSITHFERPDRN